MVDFCRALHLTPLDWTAALIEVPTNIAGLERTQQHNSIGCSRWSARAGYTSAVVEKLGCDIRVHFGD